MSQKDFMTMIKAVEHINAEYAVGMMGGSESLYEKTLRVFVRSIPTYIAGTDAGAEDFQSRFAAGVHGFKGALNQIGAIRLAALAEGLEKAAESGDKRYCAGHYPEFRAKIIELYDTVKDIADTTATPEKPERRDIKGFKPELTRAWEAADGYDCMAASEILSGLAAYCFGGEADGLIAKASEALEMFQPEKAADCLRRLLEADDFNSVSDVNAQ